MHAHSSSLARNDPKKGHVSTIFESQYTLKQCKDKITFCWGVGEDAHTGAITRSHFSVNAEKGCEKSSVAVQN